MDLKQFHLEDLDKEREEEEEGSDDKEAKRSRTPSPSQQRPASPKASGSRQSIKASTASRDLLVTIKDASDLPAADAIGTSDPLVICEIPGRSGGKFETRVIRRTLSPVWDEEHVVQGFEQGNSLLFTVMDWDIDKRELLGKASLSSAQIGSLGLEAELELQMPKAPKGSCGKLRVQVDVLDSDGKPLPRSALRMSTFARSLHMAFSRSAGRKSALTDSTGSRHSVTSGRQSVTSGRLSMTSGADKRLSNTWGSGRQQSANNPASESPRPTTWAGPRVSHHAAPEFPRRGD